MQTKVQARIQAFQMRADIQHSQKKQRTQGTTFHQHAISCGKKKSRARNEKCESDTKSVERARRVARKPKCNLARKKV